MGGQMGGMNSGGGGQGYGGWNQQPYYGMDQMQSYMGDQTGGYNLANLGMQGNAYGCLLYTSPSPRDRS